MPYSTPYGKRIAYDLDGSVAFIRRKDTGLTYDVSPAGMTALNRDRGPGLVLHRTGDTYSKNLYTFANPSGWPIDRQFLFIAFPHPMRLSAVFLWMFASMQYNSGYGGDFAPRVKVQTSSDSTNGMDGTWQDLIFDSSMDDELLDTNLIFTDIASGTAVDPAGADDLSVTYRPGNDSYRRLKAEDGRGILSVGGASARQVTAMRLWFYATSDISSTVNVADCTLQLHLYGEPDTTAGSTRVAIWKDVTDESITPGWFDWGDVPLSSSADKQFRVKNLSPALTANLVTIQPVAPPQTGTPSSDGQILLSLDGSAWTPSVEFAAISPGQTSPIVFIRRTTPANALLSNWSPRLDVAVGSWT